MADIARRADMGDKTLFKALSDRGNPTLDTVQGIRGDGVAADS